MNFLKEGREEGNSLLDSGWRRSEQEAVLISYGIFCFSFSFFFYRTFFVPFFLIRPTKENGRTSSKPINQSLGTTDRFEKEHPFTYLLPWKERRNVVENVHTLDKHNPLPVHLAHWLRSR